MSKRIEELQTENMQEFLRNGPRLSRAYKQWIAGRDPRFGLVLLAGLGALGVGKMWVKDSEEYKDYPGYAEATVMEASEQDLFDLNLQAEAEALRKRREELHRNN